MAEHEAESAADQALLVRGFYEAIFYFFCKKSGGPKNIADFCGTPDFIE
jgi:hypothetical protein